MKFDIFFYSNFNRDQIGILEAENIEIGSTVAKKYYFGRKKTEIDIVDADQCFIASSYGHEEIDYIELVKSENQEKDNFNTIFGENNYFWIQKGKMIKALDQYTIMQNTQKLARMIQK